MGRNTLGGGIRGSREDVSERRVKKEAKHCSRGSDDFGAERGGVKVDEVVMGKREVGD